VKYVGLVIISKKNEPTLLRAQVGKEKKIRILLCFTSLKNVLFKYDKFRHFPPKNVAILVPFLFPPEKPPLHLSCNCLFTMVRKFATKKIKFILDNVFALYK
jgi:hypothetical protein